MPRRRSSSRQGLFLTVVTATACLQIFVMFHPALREYDTSGFIIDPTQWRILQQDKSRKFMEIVVEKPLRLETATAGAVESVVTNSTILVTNTTTTSASAFDTGANRSNTNNPILDLLADANVTSYDPKVLPSWQHIQDMYYSSNSKDNNDDHSVIILGMERCAAYREAVPSSRRYTGVAGMFNTGTNAMMFHLEKNLPVPSIWQVPWGKHRVEEVRLKHVAPGLDKAVQQEALPVVVIRDPFHWMVSMCKSPYAAHWSHRRDHCPNLVPTAPEKTRFLHLNDTFPVTVKFDRQQSYTWDSLVHLWSDWYKRYLDAEYPRLIVRFEDMLFQPRAVIGHIADCLGVSPKEPFSFQTTSSKGHGSGTDFIKAIVSSGDEIRRRGQLTREDLEFARQHLDEQLMELFRYTIPKDSITDFGPEKETKKMQAKL